MAEEQYWVPVKIHEPRRVLFVEGPFTTYAEAHKEKELLQNNSCLHLEKEYVGVPLLATTAKEAKEKAEYF